MYIPSTHWMAQNGTPGLSPFEPFLKRNHLFGSFGHQNHRSSEDDGLATFERNMIWV